MKIMANQLLSDARRAVALEMLAERVAAYFDRRAQRRRYAQNYNTAHKLARMNLL